MSEIDKTKFTIRGAYGHAGNKYPICVCRDETGKYPSCVRPVNSHGDMILSEKDIEAQNNKGALFIPEDSVFTVEDGKRYDLSIPKDKAEWECIKHCRLISTQGRFAKDKEGKLLIDGDDLHYGNADLYVVYDNEESVRRVDRRNKIFEAERYIYEEKEKEGTPRLKQRTLLLGRSMKNAEEIDVLDFLLKEAEKNPDRIISLYNDDTWRTKLLALDAQDRSVIEIKNGLYMYGATQLGSSLDSVVHMLNEPRYRTIYEAISKQTYPDFNIETPKPTPAKSGTKK